MSSELLSRASTALGWTWPVVTHKVSGFINHGCLHSDHLTKVPSCKKRYSLNLRKQESSAKNVNAHATHIVFSASFRPQRRESTSLSTCSHEN